MISWNALSALGSIVLGTCLFAACAGTDSEETGGTDSSGSGGGTSSTTVTGSSSSAVTGSSSSSGSGGGGPITCNSPYTDIPTGECDLLQQNCQPGFTCSPQQAGGTYTTKCVMSSGLKGQATACASGNECEAGLFCIFNKCAPVCCPDPGSMSCGGGTCNVDANFGTFFIRVCSFPQTCQLFMPGSCPPGDECHLTDPMQGLAVCVAPTTNQVNEGETCNYINDCKDAQMCLNEMMMGVCRYNCDLTNWQTLQPGLGGCPVGRTCMNVGFMPPNIGVCRP